MDVQVLDQRLTMKYHLSKVRLREFVWVGGHVTVAVGWASGPNVLVSRGQGPSMSWDLWPRPVARANVGTQECTQIDENGLSGPFLGHLCTLLRRCGQARERRSVHRSTKTAPRGRFGTYASSRQTNPCDQLFAKLLWM